MSPTITIELPYPPSVNRAWRMVRVRRSARMMLSREGRAYRMEACARLAALRTPRLNGRLRVVVTLHPPDRRKRDVDNAMKALLDALQHAGVYRDDAQIDRLEVERGEVRDGGRAVVEIEELTPPVTGART